MLNKRVCPSATSQHALHGLCTARPLHVQPVLRRTRTKPSSFASGAAFTSSDDWGGAQGDQAASGVLGLVNSAWQWAQGAFNSLVKTGANAFLQSPIAPEGTPRQAVENSVRGCLALITLALLKSVLSLVLALGFGVLVVYVATQVYGFGRTPESSTRPSSQYQYDPRTGGPSTSQQQHNHQNTHASGSQSHRHGSGQYTTWNGEPDVPPQQQQDNLGQGAEYDYVRQRRSGRSTPYGRARRGTKGSNTGGPEPDPRAGTRSGRPGMGDIIDVHRE